MLLVASHPNPLTYSLIDDRTTRRVAIFVSIRSLLNSNEPPSDDEATVIQAAVASAVVDKQQLEALLSEKEDNDASRQWIDSTKDRINDIDKFIYGHRAILSPIRRIPPEVLQEMFEFYVCSFNNVFDHLNIHIRASHLPWELSHVCRLWRMSALGLPTLWNYFPTVEYPVSPRRQERQVGLLMELLRRSKQAPLFIHIYAPHFNVIQEYCPAFYLLLENSSRWGSLSLHSNFLTIAMIRKAQDRLPFLRRLTLILERPVLPSHLEDCLDTFKEVPAITLLRYASYALVPFM
ncbi:hypothetical protein BDN70DRAFT_933470 [Pholiota conissans]|uniref:F-box domain-containing protein n=1 Tax=Pholiota conissans TaxID=109636 RepID=A0A9P5YZ07_9AGAR|nr:hypothetical protein BDN70DRAFT_933470 [Pholiota conissans]